MWLASCIANTNNSLSFHLWVTGFSPGILRHSGPLCLQFFPLCLMSCHYAFSSSPYALCLATLPSVLPPMPYILPLCLQLCLISCHCALLVAGFYTKSHLRKLFMIIIWSCPYGFNKSWGEPWVILENQPSRLFKFHCTGAIINSLSDTKSLASCTITSIASVQIQCKFSKFQVN